jgi:hypothetical protein
MEQYPTNSHKSKEPDNNPVTEPVKKVEKVVEGTVIRKKKPWNKRFMESFVEGDGKSVGSYIWFDILLPAAKDTVADVFSQGIERMLWGESRSTSRRPGAHRGSHNNYVSYNRYGNNSALARREEPRRSDRRSRSPHRFDDIIIPTRVEAEEVLDRMFDLVAKYDFISVSELCELLGLPSDYTDEKYGWTDIRRVTIERVTHGYRLNLPRPEPLD